MSYRTTDFQGRPIIVSSVTVEDLQDGIPGGIDYERLSAAMDKIKPGLCDAPGGNGCPRCRRKLAEWEQAHE